MPDAVTASTRKVGLIGWPVEHSFSPAMHNAAFSKAGLDWVYLPLPVQPEPAAVEKAVSGLSALGFAGANVTIPHKLSVMPFLSEISHTAQTVGAVNTITVCPNGDAVGDNTDVYGFLAPLKEYETTLEGADALLLGAGGAARSAVYGLALAGASRVVILNRTVSRAEKLVREMREAVGGLRLEVIPLKDTPAAEDCQLVVNTTSVGMHPLTEDSPLPSDFGWRPSLLAYDLVYNPRETRFLAQARSAGAVCINGLEMLLFQGVKSYEIWTGTRPNIETMRNELYQHFAR